MPRLQPEDVSGELHRIARMPIAGASATMDDAEAEQERANALGQILDLVPSNLLPAAIALLATLPPAVGSRLMERYVDRARKAAAPAILDAVLAVSDAGARMELLEELARKLPRQSIETAAEAARAALPAVERTGEDAAAENAALFQRHRVADVLLVLARRADVPELRLRLAREARDLALTTPLLLGSWQLRALTRASLLLPPEERTALQDQTIDIALRGEFETARPESQALLLSVIAGKLYGPARRRILRLLPQFEADHQMQIRAGLADRGAL